MVNVGRPSGGCQRCRRLKTKCCETRPSCLRCERRGVICQYLPGNRFRSMNEWSEIKVQSRVATQLAACERQIPLDYGNASIGPFFDHYLTQPDRLESTWGFMPYLYRLYAEARPGSHLSLAVKACALSNMANASHLDHLAVAANRMYGKALRTLCAAIDDAEEAANSNALSTMMLLALYEGISGTRTHEELFHAHHKGQATALRLATNDPTISEINACIFSHTNRRILLRDMAERRPVTYGVGDWPANTYRSWLDDTSARLQVQIIQACAQVKALQLRPACDRDETWTAELVASSLHVLDVNQSVLTCINSCAPEWGRQILDQDWYGSPAIPEGFPTYALSNMYSTIACAGWTGSKVPPIISTKKPGRPRYQPRVDVFQSRAIGQLWNFLLCSYLHLLRAMIDINELVAEISIDLAFPDVTTIRGHISDTIHDVLASVQYLTGDVDLDPEGNLVIKSVHEQNFLSGHGLNLMWALHKICALPGTDQSIREYVLGVLDRIGTEGNVRQAINLKNLYARIFSTTKPPMQGCCGWDELDQCTRPAHSRFA